MIVPRFVIDELQPLLVQRMLGHASAKMTLDVYGSLFEEDLESLADRLEQRYG